ncbi:MAG: toll/interleukin-1 receptor domain-containing protein [Bryobacteraceae bacterium]
MPGVFISYRREDSGGYTGRLFDILSAHFGGKNIYMDLDTIQGGDNFVSVIEEKLGVSDVLIAVIGTRWLTVTESNGARRLDNPHDFVRLEIAKALERGIRVIPVLVDGAAMPRAEDLPQDLQPLSERQALDIRDSHFHADAQQLLQVLHKAIHGVGFRPEMGRKRLIFALLAVGIAAIVLTLLLFRHSKPWGRSASSTVAGKWTASVKYDWGDTYQEVFNFEVDGQEVSGTASLLGAARGILDGKIAGNRISFVTKSLTTLNSDETPHEDKHNYKGTVESDAIRFTMMTDSEIESHVPIHFTATKTVTRSP